MSALDRQTKSIICRLMAAIETPDDLTDEETKHLLEDAYFFLEDGPTDPDPDAPSCGCGGRHWSCPEI